MQGIRETCTSSSMSLGLPESSNNVSHVSVSSLDVHLVNQGHDILSMNISICFVDSFQNSVQILSDSVSTCVPKTNSFDQVEADTIIGKRWAKSSEWGDVAEVNAAVSLVVSSWNQGNLHVVSGKELSRLVNRL